MCPNCCFKSGFIWQNKAVYQITMRANKLVRTTDASKTQKKKKLQIYTHTHTHAHARTHARTQTHTYAHTHAPQIEQTGNSRSVISCILHVFTQTTSSVISLVFDKFCSFVFCFCVCHLLLLDLFCFVFHWGGYLHWFSAVSWRAPWCLQRPFLSFSKLATKRAEAASVASPCVFHSWTGAAPEGLHWLSCSHSSAWCVETQKTKKVTFQKNNPRITMFNGEHICSHSKNITFFSIVLHGRLLQKSICN